MPPIFSHVGEVTMDDINASGDYIPLLTSTVNVNKSAPTTELLTLSGELFDNDGYLELEFVGHNWTLIDDETIEISGGQFKFEYINTGNPPYTGITRILENDLSNNLVFKYDSETLEYSGNIATFFIPYEENTPIGDSSFYFNDNGPIIRVKRIDPNNTEPLQLLVNTYFNDSGSDLSVKITKSSGNVIQKDSSDYSIELISSTGPSFNIDYYPEDNGGVTIGLTDVSGYIIISLEIDSVGPEDNREGIVSNQDIIPKIYESNSNFIGTLTVNETNPESVINIISVDLSENPILGENVTINNATIFPIVMDGEEVPLNHTLEDGNIHYISEKNTYKYKR